MKDLLHIDIETAGSYRDFDSFSLNDERGSKLFENKYNKMSWDSKYKSINDAYLDNAGIISTYGKIVCISSGYIDNNGGIQVKSFYGHDEKDIVNLFNNLLKKIEIKNFNLCGFRINYFDIPWILHKLHKYNIVPANIINPYNKKPWDMRIVDTSDDWKSKFAWSFSFDEMCYELDIESPKSIMNGSEVHHEYWKGNIEDIKKYCEADVISSIKSAIKIYG